MTELRRVVRREPSQFKRSPLHPDEWIMVGENTPYYWTHQQINETFIDADQYKAVSKWRRLIPFWEGGKEDVRLSDVQ